jgi:hypothetical protein
MHTPSPTRQLAVNKCGVDNHADFNSMFAYIVNKTINKLIGNSKA